MSMNAGSSVNSLLTLEKSISLANTVVVFHSGYGHTQRLAQFVADGADAQLIAIDADGNLADSDWVALDEAYAIIFGSPTYMGMASWQFKKFADASSKRWFSGAWKDKVAGGFTISARPSGDKLSTIQFFITLSMQHGMVWVGQPAQHDVNIDRIGSNCGVMAQVGATSPAADIPQGDLDSARAYGQRVATFAFRLAPVEEQV